MEMAFSKWSEALDRPWVPAWRIRNAYCRRVSGNGFDLPFDFGSVSLPNEGPEFRDVRISSIQGFDVVLLASAIDPDADPSPIQSIGATALHPFASRAVIGVIAIRADSIDRTIEIVAEDGRGGRAVRRTEVELKAKNY